MMSNFRGEGGWGQKWPKSLGHHYRAVGRSENLGVPVLFGGHNLPPFEIGLTDLPKSRGTMVPLAPTGTPRKDRPVIYRCSLILMLYMYVNRYILAKYGFQVYSKNHKWLMTKLIVQNLLTIGSIRGNPGMARCRKKSDLGCWIYPASQSTLGEHLWDKRVQWGAQRGGPLSK